MRLSEKIASQLKRRRLGRKGGGERKSEFCENSSQSEHQSREIGTAKMRGAILQEQTTDFPILLENSRNKSD